MVDVVICCASEDQAAGRRLAEAVADVGYDAWWNDAPSPDFWASDQVVERIGGAKAAIVIWSKASRASTLLRAEASTARAQRKLVEASIDGSKPMPPFDPDQLVSLSGWRGEAEHPGWRHVLRELQRLCGAAPAPTPAVEASPRVAGRGLKGGLAALLIMSGLAAAAVVWRESGPAPSAEIAAPQPAPPPAPPAIVAPPSSPAQDALAALPPETQLAAGEPVEEAALQREEAPAEASPAASKSREERAKERSGAEERAKARPQRQAQRQRVKYQYSENMRLFCQGSGRSTRECRTFRRNSGNRAAGGNRTASANRPAAGSRAEQAPPRFRGPPS
jgi:hypothetical protein